MGIDQARIVDGQAVIARLDRAGKADLGGLDLVIERDRRGLGLTAAQDHLGKGQVGSIEGQALGGPLNADGDGHLAVKAHLGGIRRDLNVVA